MKSLTSIALLGAVSAKWHLGKCHDVEYIEKFDKVAYTGKWYEIYRDQYNMWTTSADCVTKEFSLNEKGNVDLYFRGYYNWHGWGKYSGIDGEISECEGGSSDSYTCLASMGHSYHKSPFNVLATDYKNYDIYYHCYDFWGLFKLDNLAITSRTPEMSLETQQEVKKVIKEKIPHYHINHGMYWTKQGEDRCEYYWRSENEGKIPAKVYW